ncbi:YbfB/YjiJ family MFS transporter [Bacillaceae bacterium]
MLIAMGVSRFSYTPILPLMKRATGFTEAAAGYLASSNFFGYLVGAWLAGVIKWKRKREVLLKWSLLVNIFSVAGMGLTTNYVLWFVLRFVAGVTSGLIFVHSSSLVLDTLAAKGRLTWSGIFYSGVGLGIFLSGLSVPIANRYFGWQGTWVGLAVISLLLGIFVWIWLREEGQNKQRFSPVQEQTRKKNRALLPWLILAYGFEGLGYIVSGTFLVDMVAKMPELSGISSLSWVIVGLAAIPSTFLWALTANKFGFIRALTLAFVLQAIGVVLPVFSSSIWGTLTGAVLFGATFMGITTLATSFARQIQPDNSSNVIGVMTGVYGIGQMIGPSASGIFITKTGSYDPALLFAATVLLFAILLLWSGKWYTSKIKRKEEMPHALCKH